MGRVVKALEQTRGELEKTRNDLRLAQLEDDAQAQLTESERVALRDAGVTDKTDVTELAARRDALTVRRDALQKLRDIVRGL